MAIYLGYDRVGIVKYIKVPVRANIVTLTGTYRLALNNVVGKEIDALEIKGNSVQPTYIGKNLLNPAAWETESNSYGVQVKYLKDEDCFLLNGTPNFDSNFALKYINIPVTKNDVFSLTSKYVSGTITKPSGSFAVAYFGKNDEPNKYANWTNVPLGETAQTKENQYCGANYITAFWFYVTTGVVFQDYKVKIQIEKGSAATEYEPYVGGIPSPSAEYPQTIESVGNKTSNLMDLSKVTPRSATPHVTFDYDNLTGSMVLTSEPTKYDYASVTPAELGITLEVGKTYYFDADVTITGKQTKNQTAIAFYIRYDGVSAKSIYPTADGTYHVRDTLTYTGQTGIYFAMFFNYGSPEPAQVRFDNIYFSEVDEFEPAGYKVPVKVNETITTIYLNEPLRKVGDYADYIDYKNKKVVRNIGIKEYMRSGGHGFYKSGAGTSQWFIQAGVSINDAKSDVAVGNALCNYFSNKAIFTNTTDTGFQLRWGTPTFRTQNEMTLDEFSAFLEQKNSDGNPLTIYYQLATPTEETIDIPIITLKDGANTVTIDTKVEPSETTITYWEEIIDG